MIIVDARERRPEIVAMHGGAERPLLSYARGDNPDANYSYDIRIEWDGGALKCELKQWGDAQQSMFEGKLQRQLEPVDVFIVEKDPLHEALIDGNELEMRKDAALETHLETLNVAIPVIRSRGVHDTVRILRRLEATQGATKIRANRAKAPSDSPRFAMLNALPGVNPHRRLPDGRLLGEAIWGAPGRPEAVLAALGVDGWSELPGLGPGTVQKVRRAILGER